MLTISRDVIIVGVSLILYLASVQTRFLPSIWGKLTTVAESLTVGVCLLLNALRTTSPLLEWLVWTTLSLTLVSGFHYLARTIRAIPTQLPPAEEP